LILQLICPLKVTRNQPMKRTVKAHELGLVSQQTFPISSLLLLQDPNIWIGDTAAATANVTYDLTGSMHEPTHCLLALNGKRLSA